MIRFAAVPVTLCAVVFAGAALAQTVNVPNASFEDGARAPEGWTLSGGQGEWLEGGAREGERAVSVTGTGSDSNYWRSARLALEPSGLYRVSFCARNADGAGGTPVTGPVFCNRDLGRIPAEWQEYESVFFTPERLDASSAWLRFGQWHVKGTVAFDDVRLAVAQPVYVRRAGIALGEGEKLAGNEYSFRAPFNSESRNHSRPLLRHECAFNTNRWVFGAESEVVYRHAVAGRRQTAATVEVGINWYSGGELLVSASTDGESWADLGAVGEVATKSFAVPARLLPAAEIRVRLLARSKRRVGVDSDPGSFQVGAYEYRATLDGEAAELAGRTRFLAVTRTDPKAEVTVLGLGDGLPGADNAVTLRVKNNAGRRLGVRASVSVSASGEEKSRRDSGFVVYPGERILRIPYDVFDTARLEMSIALRSGIRFEAKTTLNVAELYRTDYGELLPGSTDAVGLWWTSSGWKVSRTRPVAGKAGKALVIRAARNEVEAAQLVVRPERRLRRFTAEAEALRGPGGATIPAGNVEVLRVRYVEVTQPTDATGVAAPWPDPLPPFRGPIDLEANRNQPLWVRVEVPRDAAPGVYEGDIRLRADGFDARAPVRVHVYDLTLPDRMACMTAFGFSPGNVWRYQKVTDPAQRRDVLEKYWRSFSAHHISPYDPAPLDGLRVSWPGSSDWQGGERDKAEKHAGEGSLRVEDASATSNPSAVYGSPMPIPEKGFRLGLWHRAEREHPFIVTLNHDDAAGQWMSGRNLDMRITGGGEWQRFHRTITSFPAGARSVRLRLWATVWKDDGSPTGTVWYDDVSLQDAGTGEELVRGGDFEPLDPARLKPSFDWGPWDAAMKRAIDGYHFNSFRLAIPGMGGGTFHSRREPELLGYGEGAPEYRAAFGSYCRAMQEHLREKGWLDEAFVYWFDEPDPKDYEFVMNGFRKLKRAAPEISRMLTEQVEDDLTGGPNVWCPGTASYNHEKAEARRKAGEKFWWYVCTGPKAPYCTLFIDHPATEMRVWLWQTWKRRIDGVLVWATNYWTSGAAYPEGLQDPYADPMGWVSGYSTPAGVKRPWGNGDGRFIYPPEAAASGAQAETVLEGPVDSIRWEMLRDGIEDYEYLAMLERLLERHGAKLSARERREYEELLKVPASISESMTEFTNAPAPIEERRDAVARAIEKLRRTP